MEEICMQTPYYWKPLHASEVKIQSSKTEYQSIECVVLEGGYSLIELIRTHQLHRYGLFLLREQFLVLYHAPEAYFRVRKFVAVPLSKVKLALETNLDSRRCDYEFKFTTHIKKNLGSEYAVFIACMVTWDLYADILIPSKSSDYFIEYVAYVKENIVDLT